MKAKKTSVLCTLWLALFHSFSGLLDAAMENAFAELLACRWIPMEGSVGEAGN